ncbi:MAG: LysR family transcriptional regulator [Pseudomonadota bacterium]
MDRRLSQFLAVAEAGSVSTAAETLNVSQPTISVNIRRLEDDYGVPFFTRSSRGVTLTEFGKILYEHAKVMARLGEHATAEIRNLKATTHNALRIGTGFAWWPLFMRDILRAFLHENAEAAMHVYVCSSLDGLRSVLAGDTTCFIGTKVAKLDDGMGLEFEHLFSVEDVIFARKNHPLSGKKVSLSDLRPYPRLDVAPFVNKHLGIIEHANYDTSLAPLKKSLVGLLSTNSMTAGIDILKDTNAFLVYPILCQLYFQQNGIIALDVKDRSRQRVDIGLYRLAGRAASSAETKIVDAVRAHVACLEKPNSSIGWDSVSPKIR